MNTLFFRNYGLDPILRPLCLILFTWMLSACGTHPLTYEGDQADVHLLSGSMLSGELLMVSDSAVLLLPKSSDPATASTVVSTYYRIPFPAIKEITVGGYVNHNWWGLVVEGALGATLYLAAAAGAGVTGLGVGALILLGIPVVDAIIFAVSEPSTPEIAFPLDPERSGELLKYVRLPQDLDSAQFETVMHSLGDPKADMIGTKH